MVAWNLINLRSVGEGAKICLLGTAKGDGDGKSRSRTT
jgi:hypothetical protein